jgi:hypothetical protein
MKPWQLFTQHPASVGETYLEHLGVACTFGLNMFVGGAGCVVHAVFPFLCVHTGSECVAKMHRRLSARRGVAAMGREKDGAPADECSGIGFGI